MFEGIKNKSVLITGATGGIGAAMTKIFAEHGARVGVHYRSNKKEADRLLEAIRSKGGEAKTFSADLIEVGGMKGLILSFIKEFGGIDVLINNAGATYDYQHFSELDEASWTNTFALNVKAPFYLSGEAFQYMQGHGGGRIINISSVNVKYGGSAKSMHYVASKAALEALTIGFAREGAQYNILVNAIRCGVIDTPMRTKVSGYSEEDFKKRVDVIPLKRMGEPLDVARMALFLASECGNFITSEIFTVAGGD